MLCILNYTIKIERKELLKINEKCLKTFLPSTDSLFSTNHPVLVQPTSFAILKTLRRPFQVSFNLFSFLMVAS